MEGLRRPMDQCEPGAELPQLSQPSYVVPSGGLALSKKGPSSDADDEGDAADVHQPPGLSLRGPPDDSDDRDRDRRGKKSIVEDHAADVDVTYLRFLRHHHPRVPLLSLGVNRHLLRIMPQLQFLLNVMLFSARLGKSSRPTKPLKNLRAQERSSPWMQR